MKNKPILESFNAYVEFLKQHQSLRIDAMIQHDIHTANTAITKKFTRAMHIKAMNELKKHSVPVGTLQ